METTECAPAAQAELGYFVLPAISPEVPYLLQHASERSRVLARFALASEAGGIDLPGGELKTLEEVVAQQWTNYLQRTQLLGTAMLGSPSVSVSDETLSIIIGSRPDLNTYRLKPIVQPLEEAMTGLGWFVYSALERARGAGLFVYDMTMVAYHLDYRMAELDEFTDQHYARVILAENGERSYDDESEVSQEVIDEMRENHGHWPSDVTAAVDGHINLLGTVSYQVGRSKKKNNPPARLKDVKIWAKANTNHPHVACVNAALALHQALTGKSAPDFAFYRGQDDLQSIGAMAFVAWNDPALLWETAGHAEEEAYNCGDVVEAFARKTLSLEQGLTDRQLADLVSETKAFLNAWHLLEQLMSHFPIAGEGYDEI